jgi:hypothetical protein
MKGALSRDILKFSDSYDKTGTLSIQKPCLKVPKLYLIIQEDTIF